MSDILLGTRDTQEREAQVWPQDDTVWLQKMGEQSRMLAQEEGCASGWYTGLRRHRSSVWATCEGVQDSLKGPESPMQWQPALCMANSAHPRKENKRDPDNKAMRTQSWGRL